MDAVKLGKTMLTGAVKDRSKDGYKVSESEDQGEDGDDDDTDSKKHFSDPTNDIDKKPCPVPVPIAVMNSSCNAVTSTKGKTELTAELDLESEADEDGDSVVDCTEFFSSDSEEENDISTTTILAVPSDEVMEEITKDKDVEFKTSKVKVSDRQTEKKVQGDLGSNTNSNFDYDDIKDTDAGNCFYICISKIIYDLFGVEKHQTNIRKEILDFMAGNDCQSKEERIEQYKGLRVNEISTYEDFLSKHRTDGEWAEEPLIQAAADLYGVDIYIDVYNGSYCEQQTARSYQKWEIGKIRKWAHLRLENYHFTNIRQGSSTDTPEGQWFNILEKPAPPNTSRAQPYENDRSALYHHKRVENEDEQFNTLSSNEAPENWDNYYDSNGSPRTEGFQELNSVATNDGGLQKFEIFERTDKRERVEDFQDNNTKKKKGFKKQLEKREWKKLEKGHKLICQEDGKEKPDSTLTKQKEAIEDVQEGLGVTYPQPSQKDDAEQLNLPTAVNNEESAIGFLEDLQVESRFIPAQEQLDLNVALSDEENAIVDSSQVASDPKKRVDTVQCNDEEIYKPQKDQTGYALIVCFKKNRKGSKQEIEGLKRLLNKMSFKYKIVEDPTPKTLVELLKTTADYLNNAADSFYCFAFFLMSHGNSKGISIGKTTITFDQIIRNFKNQRMKKFEGKPKAIFINCCLKQFDNASKTGEFFSDVDNFLETNKDFYVVFSTQKGFPSKRSKTRGSHFIRILVEEFEMNHLTQHVEQMMIKVRRRCATSSSSGQTVHCLTTLLKEFYLMSPQNSP